ncbi:Bacillosamine/Legionaminic acid biosynthesis aminotransferase PglE; 4-keto-6-deoxy-N-Acetyl-D-hexosaminyl-(Lipid carrier) aminotransferase [hydrothermal vent metagenome]|uniref:Bacillosamine/Legionaminic acid biosynthesis aminotransferase PglE 4-keto-6-deoxy-N-Acetyl-D-hexosaminyl-(Lipid carrier) aminotransferase n=1 Tax=hydrothermal vent metagenome TaxID=652676 RepID=A0A1W1BBL7_9ZZZZ
MYENIVSFIQDTFQTKEFIPLHEPKFSGNEKLYLNECIDSTFVSSVGVFVDRVEEAIASYVGVKYAIAMSNGTSALHIALLLADVTKNDEVITQALTFVATPNAISYCNAQPIFLDVDLDTMSLSPNALDSFLQKNCKVQNNSCINKTTNKTIKAAVVMHTFGHSARVDELKTICDKWNIELIEDAAESLGSFYKKKHTGTFAKLGIFSFNGNKIITSGGGGVLVTDDVLLAKRAKHLSTTAKIAHPYEYEHDEIGYNYRMPNLNAALLLAQIEQLNNFRNSKRLLSKLYSKFFSQIDDIVYIQELKNSESNYWLQALLLPSKEKRDEFLSFMNQRGIMCRPIWKLISTLDMYKHAQCDSLENSFYLQDRIVNIPSSVR